MIPPPLDIAVVGAGAAGLATAIFAARRNRRLAIAALDGAKKPGAKILVSGGGRCNVTNTVVTPDDFHGGSRHVVRRILSAFPAGDAVRFFREIGVTLHEEENGKLFPDSNSARTVLEALLSEARRCGVQLLNEHRVTALARGFTLETSRGPVHAGRVVLATGGLSLPKTGSDGTGYRIATSLGHSVVPTTPALVPLVCDGDFHVPLSGVSLPVQLTVRADGEKSRHVAGSMLWTHFGVSGPAALDVSRIWLHGRTATVTASLLPGLSFETAEAWLLGAQPRAHLRTVLGLLLPAKLADAVLARLGIDGDTPMSHLVRDDRRTLIRALLEWSLPVRESRGYNHAEVTAGGIPLDEIDPATLESRRCPGLHLVGEILDVDGRLGGFNFQWAWSSAYVAAAALAAT